MLDGILTTALQIIIVLDICGAVFYFLMSGAKNKEAKASLQTSLPQFALSSQLQPAMAGVPAGAMQPPPVPEWLTKGDRSATDIYGLEGAAEVAPKPVGMSARVSGIFSSIKGKFSRQNTHEFRESADLNRDHTRLNKVLDSFREEM
jgi:hypothetical protein